MHALGPRCPPKVSSNMAAELRMEACPMSSVALKPATQGRTRATDLSKVDSRAEPKMRFAPTWTRKEPVRQVLHLVSLVDVLGLQSITCRVSLGCLHLRVKPRVSRDMVDTQLITRCTDRAPNTVPHLL